MIPSTDHPRNLLDQEPIVISLGIATFADAILAQGASVIQVDWSPPAEGDQDLLALLDEFM